MDFFLLHLWVDSRNLHVLFIRIIIFIVTTRTRAIQSDCITLLIVGHEAFAVVHLRSKQQVYFSHGPGEVLCIKLLHELIFASLEYLVKDKYNSWWSKYLVSILEMHLISLKTKMERFESSENIVKQVDKRLVKPLPLLHAFRGIPEHPLPR